MGAAANVTGKGSFLTYQGKDYPLSPWNYNVQGDFELHLEKEARKHLREACRELPPNEAADLRREVMQDITAGVYSFGSVAEMRAVVTPRHMPYLLYLQLREAASKEDRPLITPELARQMAEELGADECLDAMVAANPPRPPKNSAEVPTIPATSTM